MKEAILLVQTSFLGDTVLSTPVIAGIHQIHPDCELSTLTTAASAELLERDPLIHRRIVFHKRGQEAGLSGLLRKAHELKAYNFSRAYVLHRSARTAFLMRLSRIPNTRGFKDAKFSWLYNETVHRKSYAHEVERNLAILKYNSGNLSQELRLFAPTDADLNPELRAHIRDIQSAIVLVPGSVWATKRWDYREFQKLAQHYTEQGRQVVLIGAPSEMSLCEQVAAGIKVLNLAGKTSIREMMAVISKASLVVCNDSVALHIASAFKIPTVAVFCSTSPVFGFGPWQNKAKVAQTTGLPCQPCGIRGRRRCPLGTNRCMRELPASQIIQLAQEVAA